MDCLLEHGARSATTASSTEQHHRQRRSGGQPTSPEYRHVMSPLCDMHFSMTSLVHKTLHLLCEWDIALEAVVKTNKKKTLTHAQRALLTAILALACLFIQHYWMYEIETTCMLQVQHCTLYRFHYVILRKHSTYSYYCGSLIYWCVLIG